MLRSVLPLLGIATALCFCSLQREQPMPPQDIPPPFNVLVPLHKPLGPPGPFDWLAHHPEPGQSFEQYVNSNPTLPRGKRRVIYLQPLGQFNETEKRLLSLVAEYVQIYFGLPVKLCEPLGLEIIPPEAQRRHPEWGVHQILTTYVLDHVLYPRLPDDATAYLALTNVDLWPGPGWNFVFGQASLHKRVGVWSIYRNGDPTESDAAFRLCLMRTIKTATHELGHMFSLMHCVRFQCNMCGSNNRAERDRLPMWLCPECLAKLCWATGADPIKRYEKLAAFCRRVGFAKEAAFFDRSAELLRKASSKNSTSH